jgi:hypothetical protein
MPARLVLAILVAFSLAFAAPAARANTERAHIETLAQHYAHHYGVPLELVRRVINRESTFNPRARNGPYWGLMQILPATARTMGYRGSPEGLLDPETNLRYAVRYLRGAYLLSGGSHDRAVQLYAAGYYYHARDNGMLEETALRHGAKTPPLPPTFGAAVQVAAAQPQPQQPQSLVAAIASEPQVQQPAQAADVATIQPPQLAPRPESAAIEPLAVPAPEPDTETAPVAVALGFLPPARPAYLDTPEPDFETNPAVVAVSAFSIQPETPVSAGEDEPETDLAVLSRGIELVSAYAAKPPVPQRRETDMLRGTFSALEGFTAVFEASERPAGSPGFAPPIRPAGL